MCLCRCATHVDVLLLGQVVGVDLGRHEGVLAQQAHRALAGRVQQSGARHDACAQRRGAMSVHAATWEDGQGEGRGADWKGQQ